jgi:nucleoside triphosphate diphosphatase
MEEEFKELLKLARKTLAICPWCDKQTVKSYIGKIQDEVDEANEALQNEDYEELKGELGDIFWNTLMTMLIAEKEGWFKPEDSIKHLIEKMKQRKPFLLTDEKVSLEEAERLWHTAKAKEKKEKNKK